MTNPTHLLRRPFARFFALPALALLLAAGFAPVAHAQAHDQAHDASAPSDDVLRPTMVDGVQVVEVTAGKMGYSADRIALEAGVPARLVFTRTEEGGCTFSLQIPAFGIEPTDLPVGEPVTFEFTPDEAGTFTFACGMNMVKGSLLVEG